MTHRRRPYRRRYCRRRDTLFAAGSSVAGTRARPYRFPAGAIVTLTVVAPMPPYWSEGDLGWLCLRVESAVAVALLELLSPMVVEGVRVTR